MSESGSLLEVTDRDVEAIVEAGRGILILTKSDCGSCIGYQAEILARQARGELAGVAIAKLVLDHPGAAHFKMAHPWIHDLEFLPFTVLYRKGEQVDGFAASKGSYLMERLEMAFGEQREEA